MLTLGHSAWEDPMPRNVRCALIQASNALSHRAPARADQEGDDRQAPEADRAGRAQEGADPLPAGAFLRAVFLCGAECALVRTDRTRARRPDHATDAESCGQASHGDRGSGLRRADAGRLLQHGRRHRRRRPLSGQVPQASHPALPSRILGEVLLHPGRSWLSGV